MTLPGHTAKLSSDLSPSEERVTLDELAQNWRDYVIVLKLTGHRLVMRDAFFLCWRQGDGLWCDAGGPQGSPVIILRPDENGRCLIHKFDQPPGGDLWVDVGHFEKL